jgi:hypothetical protein
MKKFAAPLLIVVMLLAGCAGMSKVNYNRCDRNRTITRIAVIAHNITVADRKKMWAAVEHKPAVIPTDTFPAEIAQSLSAQTDFQIISPETVAAALKKLGLEETPVFTRNQMHEFRRMTGADAILFADVTFYLQNYLFYKTFGLVEISMRFVDTSDGTLLWDAKGRNFAMFISTDSALAKLREKMIRQLAKKLDRDKGMVS